MSYLKMYIVVKEEVPDNMVPVLTAHSSLGAHLKFTEVEKTKSGVNTYTKWLKESYRKVVVKVNNKQFENIKRLNTDFTDNYGIYQGFENKTLNGSISCLVLIAEHGSLPKDLSYAKLWNVSCCNKK